MDKKILENQVSLARANLCEIGYDSIPEEHVETSFLMGPTPTNGER